ITQDQSIVVSGYFHYGSLDSQIIILKFLENGTLDYNFPEKFDIDGVSENSPYLSKIIHNKKGDILIGGYFAASRSVPQHNYFIRLTEQGKYDHSQNLLHSGLSMNPHQVAKQSDGKILIAGRFEYYQNNLTKYLLRLNQNGSLDTSFNFQSNS